MTRPIDQYSAADLMMLAKKLEQQGLFAVIDLYESPTKEMKGEQIRALDERNAHRQVTLKKVVADSVRYVAEMKRQEEVSEALEQAYAYWSGS